MRGTRALLGVLPLVLSCYHVAQLAHLVRSRPDASAPTVYSERCSSCHGDTGRGDGLAGRSLRPAPRNFADRTWQAAASDDHIRFVIRHGGAAARLSSSMAAHPDLSDAELAALVSYIRSVGSVRPRS